MHDQLGLHTHIHKNICFHLQTEVSSGGGGLLSRRGSLLASESCRLHPASSCGRRTCSAPVPLVRSCRCGVVTAPGLHFVRLVPPFSLVAVGDSGQEGREDTLPDTVCGCPGSVLSVSPSPARPAVRARTCGRGEAQPGPGAVGRRSGEAAEALPDVARSGLPCPARSASVGHSITARGPRGSRSATAERTFTRDTVVSPYRGLLSSPLFPRSVSQRSVFSFLLSGSLPDFLLPHGR